MSALVYTTPVDGSTMQTLVMSLTHIAVSYLLWVFNTLPPLSSLDSNEPTVYDSLCVRWSNYKYCIAENSREKIFAKPSCLNLFHQEGKGHHNILYALTIHFNVHVHLTCTHADRSPHRSVCPAYDDQPA